MKKVWFVVGIVGALGAAGAGVWYATRGAESAAPQIVEDARAGLDRALAGGGVAAADWIKAGEVSAVGENGRYASFRIAGPDGRLAYAYLVRLDSGEWRLVSLTEAPPQCAAVERYGFPSAMIADCQVGEAQTVADALATLLAGGDTSGVRLVGTIELPPDPSCGCVLLSSGGSSVTLNISAEDLAAAGIGVGDTVVISGGLAADLSLDAASVIRASEDGTPEGTVETSSGSGSGGSQSTSGAGDSQGDGDDDGRPSTPAPEPAAPPSGQVSSPAQGSVSGFPSWTPRRRTVTTWYASPLDLDSTGGSVPSYEDDQGS
jgi:hypothetical protein